MVASRTHDTLRSTPNQPLFPSPLGAPNVNVLLDTPLNTSNNLDSLRIHNSAKPGGSPIPNQPTAANLSAAEKLRLWRHDALMQHHYSTAEYIGDKVLSLTNDPNDAFWLAQVYYSSGNYYRARQLLSENNLDSTSVSCRYLAALCLLKLEKWDEALDVIGETNPFRNETKHVKNLDGGIKLEASLCFIRGKIYANQNNLERAKECYKEAVLVDVKCYEAFDELIKNHMLTPLEEWELVSLLDFSDMDENNELVKLLYTTRINKYINKEKFEECELVLKEDFNLKDNTYVLLSKAELFYTQSKFQKCVEVCERILEKDELNFATLPTYISCLHELGSKNKLFLLSHKLAEHHPKSPVTWLAVGTYYMSINRASEARKYFSKASMLDPGFGYAWIGFAHTFAAEGEHEQAISAYSTASRFFPGTHLPNLFLGMQYLQMSNLTLAQEYLLSSYSLCPADPLLLNELGVIYYHKNELTNAENYFTQALQASRNLDSDSKAWISVHANLGHVYRRLNFYSKALSCFEKVLKLSSKDSNIYSAIGLIYLKSGEISKSIEYLHYALSINNNDPVASDLLKRALEENTISGEGNHHSKSNDFFEISKDALNANLSTFNYRNSLKSKAMSSSATPLVNKNKIKNLNLKNTHTLNESPDHIATDLINGDDSSDEDDAIMEIETD
jgi:anaphase-promoting complex subunit 6